MSTIEVHKDLRQCGGIRWCKGRAIVKTATRGKVREEKSRWENEEKSREGGEGEEGPEEGDKL